jgi:predicted DNA-binding transcriptional regulator AlpA
MSSKASGKLAPVARDVNDSLVDFHFIASEFFVPTRGRAFGITRQGLTLMVDAGRFPRPIRLGNGPKAEMRWRTSALRKWLAERSAEASS